MSATDARRSARRVGRGGRYVLFAPIASGGMGVVHLARQLGDAGFARFVAIKFLHPHLTSTAEFVRQFLSEAHLAAQIVHPNVVSTIDVVHDDDVLCLVME